VEAVYFIMLAPIWFSKPVLKTKSKLKVVKNQTWNQVPSSICRTENKFAIYYQFPSVQNFRKYHSQNTKYGGFTISVIIKQIAILRDSVKKFNIFWHTFLFQGSIFRQFFYGFDNFVQTFLPIYPKSCFGWWLTMLHQKTDRKKQKTEQLWQLS
jgi:hypothetical protein